MQSGAGRVVAVALLVAASGFLAGGYCSYRGYYTLGGTATSGQVAAGPIARFGSVFVDGAEYTTSATTVTIDGVTASEAALVAGQVATVAGTPASASVAGAAHTLVVTTRLVGPATAVDLAAHTVTVLGQTVQVTGDTSVGEGIAPVEPAGLLNGQLLAIDGYRTSTGFRASRIDPAIGGVLLRIAGRISALDGATQTFHIGATTVSYAGVTSGLPATASNGAYVIASGATVGATTTLNAQQVLVQPEATAGASATHGVVHGAVTRFASTTDFDVAGQAVSTGSATTYDGGSAASLAADIEVEASGTFDASGVLVATAVAFVPATDFRLVGPVDRIDSTVATFVVGGITLATNSATRWEDRGPVHARTFALATLRTGDWVEVRGATTGALAADGRVVERRVTPSLVQLVLEDDVSALADPSLTLAGVVVDTRGATFADVHGVTLTRSEFFAVASGHAVRARGSLASGGAFVATAVALRD
jgi:cytochrome c-type biogenesis protein CcmE